MALIARSAFKNWQRQDKAKREAEFLDSLLDAAQAFKVEMHRPVEMFRIEKMAMAAHIPAGADANNMARKIEGAIIYIKSLDSNENKRLFEALDLVGPAIGRLTSLSVKGKLFRFPNYDRCQEAIQLLGFQSSRMYAASVTIASPSWNWDNSEARELASTALEIDPSAIEVSILTHISTVLDFAEETYAQLYN